MIRQQKIQQKITQARTTFPITVVLALFLWLFSGGQQIPENFLLNYENCFWNSLLPQGVMTYLVNGLLCSGILYLLIELNNTYSITEHHRTTFHSSIFLLLWVSVPYLSHQIPVNVVTICLLLAIFQLFSCYQQVHAVTRVFWLFAFIGFASLLFPPILLYIPLFYFTLAFYKALTLRSFFAGFIGVIFFYWLLFGHAFWHDAMPMFYAPFKAFISFSPISYDHIPFYIWMTLGYTLFLSLVSSVYFFMNSYQNKLRTRYYLFFIVFFVLYSFVLFLLLPQHVVLFLSLMILGCSVLAGHLFLLSTTKVSNIFFASSIVVLLIITILNIWIPSYNFF